MKSRCFSSHSCLAERLLNSRTRPQVARQKMKFQALLSCQLNQSRTLRYITLLKANRVKRPSIVPFCRVPLFASAGRVRHAAGGVSWGLLALAGSVFAVHFCKKYSCFGVDLEVKDRKSTRLNSSHDQSSYAVCCLKKKKKQNKRNQTDVSNINELVPLKPIK